MVDRAMEKVRLLRVYGRLLEMLEVNNTKAEGAMKRGGGGYRHWWRTLVEVMKTIEIAEESC
jgi:hypothetical protein